MLQKPWFKVFIWFMATFFFFLASGVVISVLRPGPSEADVMKFMEGMMGAMDRSMMGAAMSIESNSTLKSIIILTAGWFIPIILISIITGLVLRFTYWRKKDV